MTARPEEAAVTVSAPPVAARIFRPGEIVRAEAPLAPEEGGYLVGEVIPTPASFKGTGHTFTEFTAALANPETVWVQFRRLVPLPQPVPAGDLVRLDTPRAVRDTLELLARVGIRVARHEVGIRPEVGALICDDDMDAEHHARHTQSLVLWFEDMDDVHALTDLTNFHPSEIGCNWPSVYGDQHMDDPEWDYPIIRAVHLADLPTLADLAERELAGEFGGDEKSIRSRWLRRSGLQIAALVIAALIFRSIVLGYPLGWLRSLILVLAAIPLARHLYRRSRYGRPVLRTHLDAARRMARRAVRGSGPR